MLRKAQVFPLHQLLSHDALEATFAGFDFGLEFCEILAEITFLIELHLAPLCDFPPLLVQQLLHAILQLVCLIAVEIGAMHGCNNAVVRLADSRGLTHHIPRLLLRI